MVARITLVLLLGVLCFSSEAFPQARLPLSVDDITSLLQQPVSTKRVALLVQEQGVNFELTQAIQDQLRQAGADDQVLAAVGLASIAYIREQPPSIPPPPSPVIQPSPPNPQQIRQQRIAELLAQAERQIAANHLTTPTDDNALDTFEEVLGLDPVNTAARNGKERIKDQYMTWARAAERRENWARAEQHYQKAKRADPLDPLIDKALAVVRSEAAQDRREEESHQRVGAMVEVPAGEFWMGCDIRVDGQCYTDEKPGRHVYVDQFFIDKTEVTVTAYKRCVDAGRCTDEGLTRHPSCTWEKSGRAQHPINCVNWEQAYGYCTWAGKRLPTEAEWEKAARGTDGRVFPWGTRWAADRANTSAAVDGFVKTAPVGSFQSGSSPGGSLDMAGNVREWTSDWYAEEYYAKAPNQNPRGPSSGLSRSVRGGSWNYGPEHARSSDRDRDPPGTHSELVGFRCAR